MCRVRGEWNGMACSLSRVNGQDVLGLSYGSVITRIKEAGRPVMLHFLGYYTKPASPSKGAAGATTGGGAGAR